MLYDNWCSNKTAENWNKYKDYQRVFDKLSNKVKFDHFDKAFKENENDLKKTWGLINNILGRKRQNKILIFTEKDASHKFNSYFVNVANNLVRDNYGDQCDNDQTFKKYLPNKIEKKLENCTFQAEDIRYIISQLNYR